jgi:hypothetical protein
MFGADCVEPADKFSHKEGAVYVYIFYLRFKREGIIGLASTFAT